MRKILDKSTQYVVMVLVCALMGNTIATIIDYRYWYSTHAVLVNTIYSITLGLVLWKGNEFIYKSVSNKYPWLHKPVKTVLIGFSLTNLFTIVSIYAFNFIWYVIINKSSINDFISQSLYGFIASMIAMFFISMAIHAVVFFINWKKMVLNEEALKREKLALQYESLKNQVNPHFLFNSLNVLTSLVYKDADMAARFIKQLSEVYRYVLDQKDKELVNLNDEMEFVNNFISLQKIRFDNSVFINLNIPGKTNLMVVPLSVQMLVENAFKHNIASDDNPLKIDILTENDYITVRNNIQRKNVIKDSSNIGLANIKARYEFLSNKPCEIIDDGQHFIVKLPLIAM